MITTSPPPRAQETAQKFVRRVLKENEDAAWKLFNGNAADRLQFWDVFYAAIEQRDAETRCAAIEEASSASTAKEETDGAR